MAIFSAISGISSAVGRAHLLLRQGFRQHLFVNFKPPGKSAAWAPSMSLASKCITWMFSTPTDQVSTAMSMSNRAQAALNVRGQVFLSNQAARSNSGKLPRRSLFAGGVQENHTNFPMHDALQRARVGDQHWLVEAGRRCAGRDRCCRRNVETKGTGARGSITGVGVTIFTVIRSW